MLGILISRSMPCATNSSLEIAWFFPTEAIPLKCCETSDRSSVQLVPRETMMRFVSMAALLVVCVTGVRPAQQDVVHNSDRTGGRAQGG